MTNILEKLSSRLEFGAVQAYQNLSVLPLYDGPDAGPAYLSMKEGLEQGLAEITEVSESGSVPNLKVINRGDLPLLLVDGEELIGAKQNRIVNTSMLLAAHSETVIPVSCTEQGRWNYSSRQFSDSGEFMSSKARYRKSSRVMASLLAGNAYDAVQHEVWNDVAHLHTMSGTHSHTSAMKDAYLQREEDIKAYGAAFPLLEGQKGLAVFLNGKLLGIDYISRHSAYRSLHDKLIRSHAIEALAERGEAMKSEEDMKLDVFAFFKALFYATETTQHQAVGLGTDYRYASAKASGAALIYEEMPIHLTAFDQENIARAQQQSPSGRAWGLSDWMRRWSRDMGESRE